MEDASSHRTTLLGRYFRGPLWWRDLLLVVLTVSAFGSVGEFDFVNFDDNVYVQNLWVEGGLFFENIVWDFETFRASNWHPLTWLSLQMDADFFGATPRVFHTMNLVWHLANVLLLAEVLRRMTGRLWPGAAVAALFAVHPLHVESVAWISERKDVLSTFFGLLTLAAYVRYARRPGWKRMAIVGAAFTASLLAKPMLVTIPCLLLLLDYWPLGRLQWGQQAGSPGGAEFASRSVTRLVVEKLPLFVLVGASCVMTVLAQHDGGALKSLDRFPMDLRAANAVRSVTCYLGQSFWPTDMAAYYPYPTEGFPLSHTVGAALLLAAITLIVCLLARSRPYLPVGWFWFLGALVPVIGLVQVGSQGRADRYMYFPSIGLFLMAIWSLFDGAGRCRRWLGTALVVGAIVACTWATRVQCRYWANSKALWEHTLAVTSDNFFAQTKLGETLRRLDQPEAAIAALREAVRINPRMDHAYAEMGDAYRTLGRSAEAEECFRKAAAIRPDLKKYQVRLEEIRKQKNSAKTP